jgi:protein KIAA0825
MFLQLPQILRKGPTAVGIFTPRQSLPSPWLIFALPKLFPTNQSGHWSTRCSEFNPNTAISLELKVLLGAPQANWSLLLKVLLMRDAIISSTILHHLMKLIPSSDNFVTSLEQPAMNHGHLEASCEGFLCGRECNDMDIHAKEHLGKIIDYKD